MVLMVNLTDGWGDMGTRISEKQAHFLEMISKLILVINATEGCYVTPSCFRCVKAGHHKKRSFHYRGLAADLNLFVDGVYQRSTEAHEIFGMIWESWGGTWGGYWGDGNHYSLGE